VLRGQRGRGWEFQRESSVEKLFLMMIQSLVQKRSRKNCPVAEIIFCAGGLAEYAQWGGEAHKTAHSSRSLDSFAWKLITLACSIDRRSLPTR
jgi:hypothetical protein